VERGDVGVVQLVAAETGPGVRELGAAVVRETDTGNAARLVARHGAKLLYVDAWRRWLVFDGKRFCGDEHGAIYELAKETAEAIFVEAAAASSSEAQQRLAKWALASQSAHRVEAMVRLAKSDPEVAVTPGQLDAHPELFNVDNGTVDLRTGELRAHSRADRLTMLAPVAYRPDAQAPTFARFLATVTGDNPALGAFLQRAVGYSMFGTASERVLFILHGGGQNGKTVFVETIRSLFGDYARRTPTETLLRSRYGGENRGVARLKGARFVSASEAEEGQHLAAGLVKELTGGDTVTARFLYGEQFEFRPEFTLWLATNHRPLVSGDDQAIWDRIRLVPFAVHIADEQRDPGLTDKLRAELEGILAWAVEGCLAWQRQGLALPEAVEAATGAYHQEMDTFADFLEARCVTAADASATAAELYGAYTAWCNATGEHAVTQKRFGERLHDREFTKQKHAGRILWHGITLAGP
jgi:putative DNA primase/helicase